MVIQFTTALIRVLVSSVCYTIFALETVGDAPNLSPIYSGTDGISVKAETS